MDPLLGPFLAADSASPAYGHQFHALVNGRADEIIHKIVRGRLQDGARAADAEDIASAARTQLVRRLLKLRANDGDTAPITHFDAYVARVAYACFYEHLRRRHPQRTIADQQLRYLFGNRTRATGFALWRRGDDREELCGFEAWRRADQHPAPASSRWTRLRDQSREEFQKILPRADAKTMNPADLVSALFNWIGGPVEFDQLVGIFCELRGLADVEVSLQQPAPGEGGVSFDLLVDPGATPVEATRWRECLRWLWDQMAALPRTQRNAFLLHSRVVFDWDLHGIAGIRQIAAALGIEPEAFATLWPQLPLDDNHIAERLGLKRQQVIDLRRAAREKLGRHFQEYLQT